VEQILEYLGKSWPFFGSVFSNTFVVDIAAEEWY
jgi:hypothetical protein